MSVLVQWAKQIIPLQWKSRALSTLHPDKKWLQFAEIKQRRIFVFLAGFYQNLGDLAITYAQIRFLKQLHPDAIVIAIPNEDTFAAIPMIRKYIRNEDLITIIGGGNMSDLYYHLENARREVIRSFPNNRIISFPQTAMFTESKTGKKELSISRHVYDRHKNLHLFAREPESFQRMLKYFPNNAISLVPDIVLSLDKSEPASKRTGVIVCLRDDKERLFSKELKDQLILAIMNICPDVKVTDTTNVQADECMPDTYETTLNTFWTEIRSTEVVFTDRLHCMIFCAITGTPCVALDNSNHKVSGVYNAWLKDFKNIKLVEIVDIEDVLMAMRETDLCPNTESFSLKQNEWFKPLIEACKSS